MSHNVSTAVRSIIESFANGINILARLREKEKRKLRQKAEVQHDSVQLSRSLRQGTHQIGWQYEQGTQILGEQFAYGDGLAQTSLAEILLKLNTGLVSIIASFLEKDVRKQSIDYRGLMKLSESSRRGSLDVLAQLHQRIASARRPRHVANTEQRKTRSKSTKRHVNHSDKIRGPTIARVVIEDSSKKSQLALVKPGAKKKLSHSSTSDLAKRSSSPTDLSKTRSYSSSTTAVDSVLSTRKKDVKLQPTSPRLTVKSSASEVLASQRIPAARQDSNPSYQRASRPAARSMPGLLPPYPEYDISQMDTPWARPQTISQRRITPTLYSIATDSTKLGEIPLHKWATPYDFDAMSVMNKEAMQSGWPLVDINGNAAYSPKKRFGMFRIFKKKDVSV